MGGNMMIIECQDVIVKNIEMNTFVVLNNKNKMNITMFVIVKIVNLI